MGLFYFLFSLSIFFGVCQFLSANDCTQKRRLIWKLNTSNSGKFEEFKRLFAQSGYNLEASHIDLEEIDADPIQVAAHKASQLAENIVVEDTSLDIEEASVGVNIRWLLEHLPEYKGCKAEWIVLLAFRQGNEVWIYRGCLTGTIVLPRGEGGLDLTLCFYQMGLQKHSLNPSRICSMQEQRQLRH